MDSAQSKRNFLGRNSRPSTSSATMSHGVFKRKETNLKAPTQQNGLNDLSNFRKSRPAGETHEKSFSNPKSLKEFEPKIGRPPPASVVRRPHTAAVDGKTEMKMKIGGSKFDRSESNPFKKKREIRFRNTLELIPDPIYLKKPSDSYYDELSPQLQSSLLGSFTSNRPTLIKIQDGDLSDPSKLGLNSSEMNFETEAYEDYNQGGIEDDMETNLSKRKLAPRVNLTFVDLDRHIGSRFSVNTLFREVQKNLPFVSAPEEPDLKPLRSPSETSDRNTLMNEQLNPTSTFYSNGEGKNSSESGSLRRYDDGEEIQQSPTSLATTAPDIQLKDGGSKENTGPRVEIVKTEGSEVMFQMIVPASNNFNPKLSLIQGSRSVNNIPEDLENYLSNQRPNEEELTRISERLSELNRSFESQNISKQALIHSKGIGLEKEQNIAIQPLKPERIERIENWLISVPLAPENQRLQGEVVPKSGSTSNYEDANSSFTDDGVEKGVVASVQSSEGEESDLGKDDLDEDCPESPIDRYTLSQAPIKLARTGSKSKASLIIRSNSQRLHDASLTQKNQNDAKEFIEETKSSEDNKNSQLRTSEKKLLDSHTMNIKNIRVLSQ
ncbi:hypothetical protein BY996DRAFT_944982 [Phakopsora pachyrhizi]|nr:hypothetical protein BY996DRAFT_944982 [Phakopsora pachyrhizi]